ncbi:MAG: sigma-70 family RNA polymerase sigma factor [Bacteroidales bacterium]|nr:sigma-70 family RNA polymerase sigma factor [Bacteroidales bacterium]
MIDETEFVQMIKLQEPLIYKVCYLFAHRNPDEVRDLYQDVVCALWQSRRRFRGDCAPKTWVYRVALNTVANHHRHKLKEVIIRPMPGNIAMMPCPENDELVDRLYDLISRLPAKDQKIVYLYIDGLSVEEIAEILGISYNAAGVRLHRIKKTLIQLNKKME